jgi:AraC-like DNA-binding protein
MYKEIIHLNQEITFERKIAKLTEHQMHTHDVLEVSILLENNVRYHMPHRDLIGQPGDIFVFRPFEPHWNLADNPTKPAIWIMMLFTPALVRNLAQGVRLLAPFYSVNWNPHIAGSSPEAALIYQAAVRAHQEKETKKPGWEIQQFVHALDILIHIYRYFLSQSSEESNSRANVDGIIRSIDLLNQEYPHEVDMEKIIRLSGLKKTRFYKQFFQLVGLTPNHLLTRIRLNQAVHLLNDTDLSITDIAYECGFGSASYFNKQFKLSMNQTPREYRNQRTDIVNT